jgi:hypothetical protein
MEATANLFLIGWDVGGCSSFFGPPCYVGPMSLASVDANGVIRRAEFPNEGSFFSGPRIAGNEFAPQSVPATPRPALSLIALLVLVGGAFAIKRRNA